jgi:hypothetical protein
MTLGGGVVLNIPNQFGGSITFTGSSSAATQSVQIPSVDSSNSQSFQQLLNRSSLPVSFFSWVSGASLLVDYLFIELKKPVTSLTGFL